MSVIVVMHKCEQHRPMAHILMAAVYIHIFQIWICVWSSYTHLNQTCQVSGHLARGPFHDGVFTWKSNLIAICFAICFVVGHQLQIASDTWTVAVNSLPFEVVENSMIVAFELCLKRISEKGPMSRCRAYRAECSVYLPYKSKWITHTVLPLWEDESIIEWKPCCRPPELDMPYSHYSDVIMGAMASQITSLTIVYSTVYSGADQRKLQSSASLTFVRKIHRWPVNSPHKWPVTRNMFPFDDVIMSCCCVLYELYVYIYIYTGRRISGALQRNMTLRVTQLYRIRLRDQICSSKTHFSKTTYFYLSVSLTWQSVIDVTDRVLSMPNYLARFYFYSLRPSDAYMNHWFNHHWFR